MTWQGWAEIALTLAAAIALGWPLGLYIARVWTGGRTWLDPVLKPVERGLYAVAGIRPEQSQGWMAYTGALLGFSLASFALLYLLLRIQGLLPLNPQHFAGMAPHLEIGRASCRERV